MATKRSLTWDKHSKRWKKKYKGKQLYLGGGKGKSDEASYHLALEQFEIKRAEIDQQSDKDKPHRYEYEQAIAMREEMLRWCLAENDLTEYDAIAKEIKWLKTNFAKVNPPELNTNKPGSLPMWPLAGRSASDIIEWGGRIESLRDHEKWLGVVNPAKTVESNIDEYLKVRLLQAQTGEISPQRYKICAENLKKFKAFVGMLPIEQFNGKQTTAFHTHLLQNIQAGKYAPSYAQTILTDVKTFVRWLWKQEIIENLPRNLSDLRIDLGGVLVRTIPIEVIKKLLGGASGKAKLYMLLMLNCGYTQKDIGDLKQSEVDWTNGRISRKRSKTKKRANVPLVHYKLWPETIELLKEIGRQPKKKGDDGQVFLNQRGNPLRSMQFKDAKDGEDEPNLRTNDGVRKAIVTLCEKLGIDQPAPKLFRKTSATLLYNEPKYRSLNGLFLGHAPKSVADIAYNATDTHVLDEAIDWLRIQYGIGQLDNK